MLLHPSFTAEGTGHIYVAGGPWSPEGPECAWGCRQVRWLLHHRRPCLKRSLIPSGFVHTLLFFRSIEGIRQQRHVCPMFMPLPARTAAPSRAWAALCPLTLTPLCARSWERERAQHLAHKDEEPGEAHADGDEGESTEPHEVALAREEVNMLLAEQRKTAALKVRRGAGHIQGHCDHDEPLTL